MIIAGHFRLKFSRLRNLLAAFIRTLHQALSRLAIALINLGQAVKAGVKLLFHELGQLLKRGGDRLEWIRDNLLAGMH